MNSRRRYIDILQATEKRGWAVDGYNFEKLKEAILALSMAKTWEVARKEWVFTGVTEAEEPETCLCGHTPIIDLCQISNRTTGKQAEVGNRCVKRFFGFRSDLIFQSLRRIKKDLSKSIGPDATAFFYQRGILNSWEYEFQQSTLRKRKLTPLQLDKRRQINLKVLASIKRRGLA